MLKDELRNIFRISQHVWEASFQYLRVCEGGQSQLATPLRGLEDAKNGATSNISTFVSERSLLHGVVGRLTANMPKEGVDCSTASFFLLHFFLNAIHCLLDK